MSNDSSIIKQSKNKQFKCVGQRLKILSVYVGIIYI